MARIPAGTVTLHDARRKVRWSVELETFEIGVFAVTQEQLAEVIGESATHPRRPATDVSWLRAIRFCNGASEWEGLDPAYSFDGEEVTWHVDADGYRLPTEAEWEHACRAGSTGPHYGPLADVAWTSADGVTTPQNVGGKHPNVNGLFDTLGNVWEWCWDLLDPARYDAYRVFRGGGFADDAWSVRASTRRQIQSARMIEPAAALPTATAVVDVPGQLGVLTADDFDTWTALGLALTAADLVGTMRGAVDLATGYAKERHQYGRAIGSFQAVQHLLADAFVATEGARSVALHAAWAVDALPPGDALAAGAVAKAYSARAARTVCETAIQVHGGIGNTWECLAHVHLRRSLLSSDVLGGADASLDLVLAHHRIGAGDGLR